MHPASGLRRSHFEFIPVLVVLISSIGCDTFKSESGLEVVAYQGPAFDSSAVELTWEATIGGDEARLVAVPPSGAAGVLTVAITLVDGDPLPSLEEVWYGPYRGLGSRIENATVEIQSWDLRGEISGVLRADLRSGEATNERFWVDAGGL